MKSRNWIFITIVFIVNCFVNCVLCYIINYSDNIRNINLEIGDIIIGSLTIIPFIIIIVFTLGINKTCIVFPTICFLFLFFIDNTNNLEGSDFALLLHVDISLFTYVVHTSLYDLAFNNRALFQLLLNGTTFLHLVLLLLIARYASNQIHYLQKHKVEKSN